MKKVGLIDLYLDNWHANHLPELLANETHGEYVVSYAWAALDPAVEAAPDPDATLSTHDFCEKYGVELCASAAEVVEKSDVLLVLAPNNPETHEGFSKEALASGKRTYIDKTFAPDLATAKRIFAMAKAGNTPMFSSSALRFSRELYDVKREGIRTVQVRGSGRYKDYCIHQIEMIVSLMGAGARRVMALGTADAPQLVVEFEGGRYATWGHFVDCPFSLNVRYDSGEGVNIPQCSGFFPMYTHELVDFFENGTVKVPEEETLAVIGIREASFEALTKPGCWVDVPV